MHTLHLMAYTQKRLLSQRQTIFAERNTNGKALIFLARTGTSQTMVATLKSPNGEFFSNPKDMCVQFMDYYAQLYESRSHKSVEEISSFLEGVPLPSLCQEFSDALGAPIIEEEIQRTIAWMATRNSPGA